jgi:DEAD/DEAH box helicase domain-containing protein
MKGPRVLVLDIETLRGADEVGGWGNSHLMGMALAVAWSSVTEDYTTYYEKDAEHLLEEMEKADIVVGFNIVGFDYKVLAAYDNGSLGNVPTFDILADVRKRLGFRLSLAHLAEHTLGASKSADGLQSLAWVREGRLDLVEEYCRQDVRVTKDLFYHGLGKGWLRFRDRSGREMELKLDWDLPDLVKKAVR